MNKKIQQYGVAVFATMTAVGTAAIIPDDSALESDGTFSVKVLYKKEAVEQANLLLVDLNTEKRNTFVTDAFGFGREYSARGGYKGDKYHTLAPGSYAIIVDKEGIPQKKDKFFMEEDGFTEKVIVIKDPPKPKIAPDQVETEGTWSEKALLPVSKINSTSHAIKGDIYLFGGWRGYYLNSVEMYSPRMDRWEKMTPMRFARDHHSSSLVANKVYMIAGHNKNNESGLRETEIYDPARDSWSLGDPIPTKRYDHSSSVVRREIYVFGGRGAFQSTEIYDTQTDTWRSGTPMPTRRYSHSSHVVNNRIYLIGGRYGKQVLQSVEEYDPRRDRWTAKTPMPTPRYSHCGCVIDDKIYIFGGKGAKDSVAVYDPGEDSWVRSEKMPFQRYNASCSESGNKVYLLGGNPGLSKNARYTPGNLVRK